MNSSEKLADNIFKKFRLSILFLIVSVIIFVSCRVNKAYERPEIATGEKFRGQATADTLSIADKQWKEIFNSDDKKYWGAGDVYNAEISSELINKDEEVFKLRINLPPLAGIVIG